MNHNFPAPEEAQLEKLIVSVYERLPVAEISRLNRVEERLVRKLALKKTERKVNTLPWWIVLLLAGGIAAAAWQIGEILSNRGGKPDTEEQRASSNVINQDKSGVEDKEHISNQQKNDTNINNGNSPIIYRRENF